MGPVIGLVWDILRKSSILPHSPEKKRRVPDNPRRFRIGGLSAAVEKEAQVAV